MASTDSHWYLQKCAAYVLLACVAAGGGCRVDSYSCENLWRELVSSKSRSEEHDRVRAFAACARERGLVYEVAVSDRAHGNAIAVGDLESTTATLRVLVVATIEGKRSELSWDPIDKTSVYELLRE
jgi:hypothetical protein